MKHPEKGKKARKERAEKAVIAALISIVAFGIITFVWLYFSYTDRTEQGVSQPASASANYSILTSKNSPSNFLNITDTLPPGYSDFFPFVNITENTSVTLRFESNYPVDVYFVPSDSDYENFMNNTNYTTYQGCFSENKPNATISCAVSGGGIIVYNPNSVSVDYSVLGR